MPHCVHAFAFLFFVRKFVRRSALNGFLKTADLSLSSEPDFRAASIEDNVLALEEDITEN